MRSLDPNHVYSMCDKCNLAQFSKSMSNFVMVLVDHTKFCHCFWHDLLSRLLSWERCFVIAIVTVYILVWFLLWALFFCTIFSTVFCHYVRHRFKSSTVFCHGVWQGFKTGTVLCDVLWYGLKFDMVLCHGFKLHGLILRFVFIFGNIFNLTQFLP